jgi:hypothetical protein
MSSSTLTTIQTELNLYGYPILMILGNIGNVFILIIFSRQRQNPCAIYLMSSSIVNSVYLISFGLVQIFSFYYGGETIFELAFCKIYGYILNVLGQIARTMVVLACVDRFMITNERATFRAFSTLKRAKWFIFFSIIFWFLFDIHIPIMRTIINGQCVLFGIYTTIYTLYAIIFVSAIPIIILCIFGYLTYHNMRQIRLRVQPIIHNRIHANNSIRRQDRNFLIIVISEVLLFIIATIPFPLILLEMMISRYIISNKSVQYSQIESFILSIAYLLLFANSAMPFYIYLISSKSFRQDFKQLIRNAYRKLRGQPTILTVARIHQTLAQRETRV